MPRIKREVAELRTRAIDSLVLGIELFNRPHDRGRAEAVLILLHHAFEMLLKAIIKDRTGTVHTEGEKYTYGFDKCLDVMQNALDMISVDERMALSMLDGLRDTSVHYFQVMSEDLLYIQAQAATTLFDAILNRGFGASLADSIPSRVLPISAKAPKDVQLLVGSELQQIDELLVKGSRKGPIAAARLRPLDLRRWRASQGCGCRGARRRRGVRAAIPRWRRRRGVRRPVSRRMIFDCKTEGRYTRPTQLPTPPRVAPVGGMGYPRLTIPGQRAARGQDEVAA